MNDKEFLAVLNDISRDHGLTMPVLRQGDPPSGKFLSDWAAFLESCVKRGIPLSDPRWQRVTIVSNAPHAEFAVEAGGEEPPDSDFRVGLQLLMGMLEQNRGAEADSEC